MECPQCHLEVSSDSAFCSRCGWRILGAAVPFPTRTETYNYFAVTLEPGRVLLDKYRILGLLGRGGMGIVYKAEDIKLKRTIALKFLRPEFLIEPEAKKRFLQEAQAAAALDHPHICTVYEVNDIEGQTFIAMPFIEGKSLKEKIETESLDLKTTLSLIAQIADGLAEAHAKGIVHRDIKPANIMVTDRNQAKIMDFGLAKLMENSEITHTTKIMGTVAYMSPEQASGTSLDARTDLWSLGVVLFEFLAGRLPFQTKNNQALLYSILNEIPPPVRRFRPELPPSVEAVVERCLQKDPDQRYGSAGELTSDLQQIISALDTGVAPRLAPRPRAKRRGGIASMKVGRLAAVMILVVLAGGGALLLKKRPAVSAAPPAAAVAAEMPEPIPVRDVLSDGRYATADAGSAKGFQIGATGVVISRADYDRNRTRRAIAQFFVKTADAGSCQMEMLNATEPIRPGDFAELSKEPRGTLVIRAEPEEAEISVDGKPIGRTNVRLLLAPGTYQLAVAKRGFVTKRDDVIVRASEIVPKSYVLLAVPPPPPQTGNLFVDSEPQGALIYLDDRKVAEGKTPLTLTALTPRMYRVRLAIESFKESIQDIEVRGGQNAQTQKAVLEPSPVIIDLQSAPSEADVFIDGGPTAEGRTPFVKPYAPGPHHIKVRKPGYTDHEEDVSLTAGSHWVKFVTLEPPPAAPKYPLKVDSVPSFARVYLNGEEQGRTPFSRELSEPQVQMRVEYEGYFPANESLVLKPGEPTIREVKLTKLGTGKVSVSSFRAARLEIDGRLHPGSVSTVRRIEIPEGSRTLRFLFDDNVAVVKTISILPEAELAVHCSEDDHRKEFAQKSAYEIGAYPSAALTLDGVIQGNVSALKLLAVGQGPHQIHFQFLVPSSGAWTFEIEDRLAALQKKRIHMAFESQDLAADDLSSLAKGGPLPESSDVLIARADLPLTVAVDDGPEAESAPGRDLRITAGPRGGRRIGLHWKQSDGKGKASILIYRLKERQLFKFTLQWTGL